MIEELDRAETGYEAIEPLPYKDSEISAETIKNYFEFQVLERVFNPLESPTATQRLGELTQAWAGRDRTTVVFSSGVYDNLHPNHNAYLLDTKLAAAPRHYEHYYSGHDLPSWSELTPIEQVQFMTEFLRQDELKLVISVDGNEAVARRKGHNSSKGNTSRPIYDWQTRVWGIASITVELDGQRLTVVDAVTLHDNAEPGLANTPHTDIMSIAEFIKPDVWSVYFESTDILERLGVSGDAFTNTEIRRLVNHDYYTDKLVGGFSTSNIVKRLLDSDT